MNRTSVGLASRSQCCIVKGGGDTLHQSALSIDLLNDLVAPNGAQNS